MSIVYFTCSESALEVHSAIKSYLSSTFRAPSPCTRRKISEIEHCSSFKCLDAYPDPPFLLNDPLQEFLMLSQVFDFDSEVEFILRLEPEQAGRCKSRLIKLGAIQRGKITQFGKKLQSVPLSIQYAYPIAQVFSFMFTSFKSISNVRHFDCFSISKLS